jgi:hypothetical protein
MTDEDRSAMVKTTLACGSYRSMIITFFIIYDRNRLQSPEIPTSNVGSPHLTRAHPRSVRYATLGLVHRLRIGPSLHRLLPGAACPHLVVLRSLSERKQCAVGDVRGRIRMETTQAAVGSSEWCPEAGDVGYSSGGPHGLQRARSGRVATKESRGREASREGARGCIRLSEGKDNISLERVWEIEPERGSPGRRADLVTEDCEDGQAWQENRACSRSLAE